jgi:hypothetical protein
MPSLKRKKCKRKKVFTKAIIECPICLDKIKKKEVTTTNKCFHKFCLLCIKEWSKTKETCPLCRIPYEWLIMVETKETIVVKKSEFDILCSVAENIAENIWNFITEDGLVY